MLSILFSLIKLDMEIPFAWFYSLTVAFSSSLDEESYFFLLGSFSKNFFSLKPLLISPFDMSASINWASAFRLAFFLFLADVLIVIFSLSMPYHLKIN